MTHSGCRLLASLRHFTQASIFMGYNYLIRLDLFSGALFAEFVDVVGPELSAATSPETRDWGHESGARRRTAPGLGPHRAPLCSSIGVPRDRVTGAPSATSNSGTEVPGSRSSRRRLVRFPVLRAEAVLGSRQWLGFVGRG